jgi:hypothetical protein
LVIAGTWFAVGITVSFAGVPGCVIRIVGIATRTASGFRGVGFIRKGVIAGLTINLGRTRWLSECGIGFIRKRVIVAYRRLLRRRWIVASAGFLGRRRGVVREGIIAIVGSPLGVAGTLTLRFVLVVILVVAAPARTLITLVVPVALTRWFRIVRVEVEIAGHDYIPEREE